MESKANASSTDALYAQSVMKYASIPLPADMVPTTPPDFANLSAAEIRGIPPHVLMHIMRTGAQGGLQVISPRQVPSSQVVRRTADDSTATFIHVAGSDASPNMDWPVPEGCAKPDMSMFADEPLRKIGKPLAHRTPARAEPLVNLEEQVPSAIQRAWIKARANCTLQMCEDVAGDPETLAAAYEAHFKAPPGSLMRDPGLAIHPERDLKDHAIVVDTSMARQLAPTHVRRVLSVAVGASTAEAFGKFSSFDWTSARVTAETKYYLSVQNEHLSLIDIARKSTCEVGRMLFNPAARSGVSITYHPTPGSAWSHRPDTFSVHPDAAKIVVRNDIHEAIAKELRDGAMFTSPVVAATSARAAVHWVKTRTTGPSGFTNDVFENMPALLGSATMGFSSIARTGSKALRSILYDAIAGAPLTIRCKLTRALTVVREGAEIIGRPHAITGRVMSTLASRLLLLNNHINSAMHTTAMTRGANGDDWYANLIDQLPSDMRVTSVGGLGWARIAVYLMFNPPDNGWRNLMGAIKANTTGMMVGPEAHSGASRCDLGGDHEQAIVLRLDSCISRQKEMYGASYDGAALGCILCARMAEDYGLADTGRMFRVASHGWTLRKMCMWRIVTSYGRMDWTVPDGCEVAVFSEVPEVDGMAVTARWDIASAVESWRTKVARLGFTTMAPGEARDLCDQLSFLTKAPDLTKEIGNDASRRAASGAGLRYAYRTDLLAKNIESNLTFARNDCAAVVKAYANEIQMIRNAKREAELAVAAAEAGNVDSSRLAIVDASAEEFTANVSGFMAPRDEGTNGWYWLPFMEPCEADWIMEQVSANPDMNALMKMIYGSAEETLDAIDQADTIRQMEMAGVGDVLARTS